MDWTDIPIPQSKYAFSDPVFIKKWNGGSITAQVGYVREHPERNIIRLEKHWAAKGGQQTREYNISKGDWSQIRTVVEGLLPEIGESPTESDIDGAIQKISQETQLLDVIAKYPDFLRNLPEHIDILALPEPQKKAFAQFLSTGGEIAKSVIGKLSTQPIADVEDFSKLLEALQLSTINSLVTHVTGRISFIDMFEQKIHDDASYEKRGPESIHNLLRANMWLVDRNYTVLHDDETLRNIILTQWDKKMEGKTGETRPDFLCMTDGLHQKEGYKELVIIEIKRPSVKIKMEHIQQIMGYKTALQEHSGMQPASFTCYIVGREIDHDLRMSPLTGSGFITKTYTDFIGDARKFYHDYLEIVAKEKYAF